MSNNSGTLIIAPIRPQSDQDIFPSALANEILGGAYQVGSASARDAIPAARRQEGMTCYLQDTQATYRLVGGIDNANWEPVSFGGGHIIQYGSTSLPQEPALKFIGSVQVTDTPGSASVVNILNSGGTVVNVLGSAPVISSGGTSPIISLATSSVTPGTYNFATVTVNNKGIVTYANSGNESNLLFNQLQLGMRADSPMPASGSGFLYVNEISTGGIDNYVVFHSNCNVDLPASTNVSDTTNRHYWYSLAEVSSVPGRFSNALPLPVVEIGTTSTSYQHDFDWVGDYTLDFWMHLTSTIPQSGGLPITTDELMIYSITYNSDMWRLLYTPATKLVEFGYWQGGSNLWTLTADLTNYLDAFHHFALVKSSSTFTMYADGNSIATTSISTQPTSFSSYASFVVFDQMGYYTGMPFYVDEIRFSKGIARWSSNFTPPIYPYTANQLYAGDLYYEDGAGNTYDIVTLGSSSVKSVTAITPIYSSGGTTPTVSLSTSSVVPGNYTNAGITVDSYGRITYATTGVITPGHVIQYSSSSLPQQPNLIFGGNVSVTNDNSISGSVVTVFGTPGSLSYYFQNSSSSIPGYKDMFITPYTVFTTYSTGSVPTNAVLLNFVTPVSQPNLSFIPAGQFEFHIHGSKTLGTAHLYAEFWECTSSGTDINLIGTSALSPALGSTELEYRLFFSTVDVYTMASLSSRVVVRIKATTSSLPTIDLYYGQEADSHITLPSPTVDSTNFVPYTNATQDVNLGSHNFTTSGTISSKNLQVSSGAVPGNVFTSLDSSGNGYWSTPISGSGSTNYGSDWKNAKLDYGAVGNGVADDTVALSNAFSSGYNIYLPGGTYKITSALTINHAVTIQGAGKFETGIYPSAATIDALLIESDLVTLKDFQINHSSVTATAGAGIAIGQSGTMRNWVELYNIDMYKCYNSLYIRNANDSTFSSIGITTGINIGIYMNNINSAGDNVFFDVIMTQATSNNACGLYIDSADVTHYYGIKILNYKYPIKILGATGNVQKQFFTSLSVEGTTATDKMIDIEVGGAYLVSTITINGGNVGASNSNSSLTGLYIGNGVTDCNISDFIASGIGTATSTGMSIYGQYITIQNCNITTIAGRGLYLGSTASHIIAASDNIHSNSTYGIVIDSACTYLVIANNASYNNTSGNYSFPASLYAPSMFNNFISNPGIVSSFGDNLNVGIQGPIQKTTGRSYISVTGDTDSGVYEMGTRAAESAGSNVGIIQWSDWQSTNADKRVAYIISQLRGSTSNNVGADLQFYTKQDNGNLIRAFKADENQIVTFTYPLTTSQIAPSNTNGQVLTTIGGATVWAAPSGSSSTGSVIPSQITPGTNGQVLTTVGGITAWATAGTGSAGGSGSVSVTGYSSASGSVITLTNVSTLDFSPSGTSVTITNEGNNIAGVTVSASGSAPSLPTGAIIYMASGSVPTGYLKANGAAISRTTYASLYSTIGTTYGIGDGSLTFNVPDLRGRFIRSWDDSAGVDTSRILGSLQAPALVDHQHSAPASSTGGSVTYRPYSWMQTYYPIPASTLGPLTVGQTDAHNQCDGGNVGSVMASGVAGTPAVSETGDNRPTNVALMACIKY